MATTTAPKAPSTTTARAAKARGFHLSPSDCQRLEAGFGKSVEAILKDVLSDADHEASYRRQGF